MAHPQQQAFIEKVKQLYPEYFTGATVLEFGSLNLNGGVRQFFTDCHYTGVDIVDGPDVDVVSRCHNYHFNPQHHPDVVISCEMLEHDEYWDESLKHMATLLKSGGLLLVTCATRGRPEHGTREHSPADSPATNDYYRNIDQHDVVTALQDFLWNNEFDVLHLEVNRQSHDLYLYAIKKQ